MMTNGKIPSKNTRILQLKYNIVIILRNFNHNITTLVMRILIN